MGRSDVYTGYFAFSLLSNSLLSSMNCAFGVLSKNSSFSSRTQAFSFKHYVVLCCIFKSIIYFESISVQDMGFRLKFSFGLRMPNSSTTTCWKTLSFFQLNELQPWSKINQMNLYEQSYPYVSIPWPLSCCINLCVCVCVYNDSSHIIIDFKIIWAILVLFPFQKYFRVSFLYLQENLSRILIETGSILEINLRRNDNFTMLSLLIHTQSIFILSSEF